MLCSVPCGLQYTFGRSRYCDVTFTDIHISTNHCRLYSERRNDDLPRTVFIVDSRCVACAWHVLSSRATPARRLGTQHIVRSQGLPATRRCDLCAVLTARSSTSSG